MGNWFLCVACLMPVEFSKPLPPISEAVLADNPAGRPLRVHNVTVTPREHGFDQQWHRIPENIFKRMANWVGRTRGGLNCVYVKSTGRDWNWGVVEHEVEVRWRVLQHATDEDFGVGKPE